VLCLGHPYHSSAEASHIYQTTTIVVPHKLLEVITTLNVIATGWDRTGRDGIEWIEIGWIEASFTDPDKPLVSRHGTKSSRYSYLGNTTKEIVRNGIGHIVKPAQDGSLSRRGVANLWHVYRLAVGLCGRQVFLSPVRVLIGLDHHIVW